MTSDSGALSAWGRVRASGLSPGFVQVRWLFRACSNYREMGH